MINLNIRFIGTLILATFAFAVFAEDTFPLDDATVPLIKTDLKQEHDLLAEKLDPKNKDTVEALIADYGKAVVAKDIVNKAQRLSQNLGLKVKVIPSNKAEGGFGTVGLGVIYTFN